MTRAEPPTTHPGPQDFPLRTHDKLRYSDTDRQGHVNNARFASFLETGRVELIYDPEAPLHEAGAAFVIARLSLDFLAEIRWPGEVTIGTGVQRVGNSSLVLRQAIFQDDACVATAETVIVQTDAQTGKARPLSQTARDRLEALKMSSE